MNRWREEDFLFHQQHATLVAGDRKPIWWKKHYDLLGLKQTVFKNQVRSVLSRISFKKPSFYCQIREEQSKSKRKMEGRCAHWSEAGKALSWPRDWGHRWAQPGGEGMCPCLPAFKGRTESEGDDSVVTTSETGFPPYILAMLNSPFFQWARMFPRAGLLGHYWETSSWEHGGVGLSTRRASRSHPNT